MLEGQDGGRDSRNARLCGAPTLPAALKRAPRAAQNLTLLLLKLFRDKL